jgi:ABC-2 type transport system permease protein
VIRGFDAALRMEWVRMTTLRATALIAVLTLLLSLAVALIVANATRDEALDAEISAIVLTGGGALIPLPLAAVFMAVLSVLAVGHDYRHGLVRPVLAAVPRRSALVAARLYVVAAVSVLVTVASLALNGVAAFLVTGDRPPLNPEVLRALAGYVLLVVLWAWLGAGATWLVRSTAAVLTAMLVIPLVVEPLIGTLPALDSMAWLEPVVPWLPFEAGRSMVLTAASGDAVGTEVSALRGGLVFTGFVCAFLAAGWARFANSDA